jgi:hypothetical protein
MTTRAGRNNPEYLYYLAGKRALLDVLNAPDETAKIHPVLPPLNPPAPKLPGEDDLCALSRAALVRELMDLDSSLTSGRLLRGLQITKLAHMLALRRQNARVSA